MSARGQFEAEKRRRARERSPSALLSLLAGAILAPPALVLLAVVLDVLHGVLLLQIVFSAILAGIATALALRYMSGEQGHESLAWRCLKDVPRRPTTVTRGTVRDATDAAMALGAEPFGRRSDRLHLLAQLILMLGALATAVGIVDSFNIIDGEPDYFGGAALAYSRLGLALMVFVPMEACRHILSTISERRLAEVRAVARVLLDHATEGLGARAKE